VGTQNVGEWLNVGVREQEEPQEEFLALGTENN
jgi:hypothetical protein